MVFEHLTWHILTDRPYTLKHGSDPIRH